MKLRTAVQFSVFQFYFAPCLISVCRPADGSCALDAAIIWRLQAVLVVVIIREDDGCHYNDWLSLDSARVRIPAESRDFYLLQTVQTGSGAHPASYSMRTGVFFFSSGGVNRL